jgi:hypothetical protein
MHPRSPLSVTSAIADLPSWQAHGSYQVISALRLLFEPAQRLRAPLRPQRFSRLE